MEAEGVEAAPAAPPLSSEVTDGGSEASATVLDKARLTVVLTLYAGPCAVQVVASAAENLWMKKDSSTMASRFWQLLLSPDS